MKKTALFHPGISKLIAESGHLDEIVICDSGFPIPSHVERIDLALTNGVPSFIETLTVVLSELYVQEIRVSEEMMVQQPELFAEIQRLVGDLPVHISPHEQFKARVSQGARAVIRTGECTPFANISLICGVIF